MKNLAAGRFIRATGSDAEAARLAGIRPQLTTFAVFVFMGALTGLAALLNLVQSPQVDPKSGAGLELKAIAAAVAEGKVPQRKIGKEEIIERTIYGLINEVAFILDEGHALRSVDIDIVYIYGYGFPAFRGGPMFYADTIGLKKVYDRVCQFEKEHGFWWKPSPLLKRLAEAGQTFADFDRQKWGVGA